MNSKSEKIVFAYKESRLLKTAYELSRGSDENRQAIISLLSDLHNKGEIDLVVAFSSLQKSVPDGPNFFLARHLFEKALPALEAPTLQVMACVMHLSEEAGDDLAANTIFGPFIDFLAANPTRPSQALEAIHNSPDQWSGFVCPAILAGARINLEEYFGYAIELANHKTSDIGINAIYSLGRVSYPNNSPHPERAIEEIERIAIEKSADNYMAVVVRTACSLARSEPSLVKKARSAVFNALKKGSDQTLHAASEEFGFHAKELPDELLSLLTSNLPRIKAESRGSIGNIDFGISALLERSDKSQAIECLEAVLIANADKLTIKEFKSVTHKILSCDLTTINKLLTRWFLADEQVLHTGISEIVDSVHGNQLLLEIEADDLQDRDPITLVFLARKAIGYLFLKPLSVTSIIISLLRSTTDEKVIRELGHLLINPVLLNYPGAAREFLESCISNETDLVAEVIQSVLNGLEEYFKELGNIKTIPELHPTLDQREAHLRKFSRQMSESYKEAMKGSLVELIATKSTILYGRSSINYVRNDSADASRMEIPMKEHTLEMEFPRRQNLDPFGLDYMLRVYRAERMVEK